MFIDYLAGFSFCISRSIEEKLVMGSRLEENQKSKS